MELKTIQLSNFQSFPAAPTSVVLDDVTFLIGPNGSGKTAILQALCRLFAFDSSLRRIRRSDFHIPYDEKEEAIPEERNLWIEVDFVFPELKDEENHATIPPHFSHMRLESREGHARARYRLNASMGLDGDIEENLEYVLEVNDDGSPQTTAPVTRAERNLVQVHYLPARRDPSHHIAYGTNALLGRMLRAVNWTAEREKVKEFTDLISASLATNPSVASVSNGIKEIWSKLHKGTFFADPTVSFVASEIESLLRHLSVSFAPGHDENNVDFSRLSDGHKSMLYLSIVLSSQAIGRAVLAGDDNSFDVDRLRPPVFTVVAIEEPENSLSPHYLGRIVNALSTMSANPDAQALIATHAPSMLKRVDPTQIRYLRLTEDRTTQIKKIRLPDKATEAHKFVREAVQSYPEIYFSRLVVLGEGDSEEIILPRILQAKGAPVDESAVTIAPLGGRHINHFWRLLSELEIPFITLLDLDVARYQGGWGRIKYVNDQLIKFQPEKKLPEDYIIPDWNSVDNEVREYQNYLDELENRDVYFSYPMDIDFAMLVSFPNEFDIERNTPTASTIKAVLGSSHHNSSQYESTELELFSSYHKCFKLGSKPATHFGAFSKIDDGELLNHMPESLGRLAEAVKSKLAEIPE